MTSREGSGVEQGAPSPAPKQPASAQIVTPRAATWHRFGIAILAALAFAFYAHYRVRYVGGCDGYSYMSQAYAFAGRHDGLDEAVASHAILAPVCHAVSQGRIVSVFPPGYPLLLALGAMVGAEYFVTPLFGALSAVLLFVAISRRASASVALVLSALWCICPMVVFGSMLVMSDLVATVFILAVYLMWDRGRGLTAGTLAGFSCGIRPTNVLFAIPMLAAVWRQPGARRFWAGCGAGLGAWALYVTLAFGAPWHHPYVAESATALRLDLGYFRQLTFLSGQTALLLGPVLALALVGVAYHRRRVMDLLLWIIVFFLAYAAWGNDLSVWWEARFVLPAYPAVFLLAGLGLERLIQRTPQRFARATTTILLLGAVGWGVQWFRQVAADELSFLSTSRDQGFGDGALAIAATVPPNSLLVAWDFEGALRLYGKLQTVPVFRRGAPEVMGDAHRAGLPVFTALYEGELETAQRQGIFSGFLLEPFRSVSPGPGVPDIVVLAVLPRSDPVAACRDPGEPLALQVGKTVYRVFPSEVSQARAELCCRRDAEVLAFFDDAADQKELVDRAVAGLGQGSFWIGLADSMQEGTFVWLHNRKRSSFSAWSADEPNDSPPGEDCVELVIPGGAWNDLDCAALRPFACRPP